MARWPVLLTALLLFPEPGRAAGGPEAAAATLARKTAALAGRGEAVAVSYNNLSSLAPTDLTGLRAAFESTLRDAGCRPADTAAIDARLTLSENPAQYLLVEEIRKGEERQAWIASWDRAAGAPQKAPSAALELKQLWRQPEQILDVAFPPAGMLLLTPARLTLYTRAGESWIPRASAPIASAKPWPRDLRGRVRATGATFQAFLPGVACNGTTEPALAVDCRSSDAPWVLESGSRGLLLAAFAAGRNFFDGRIVTQTGARKTVAPFYSAAAVEAEGRTVWLLAQVDGRVQLADASLEPSGAFAQWTGDAPGSDLVSVTVSGALRRAIAGDRLARRRRQRTGRAAGVHSLRPMPFRPQPRPPR